MIARRIPWRWLLAGLAAFLIAGLAAPFLSADRYGERIREALEASLGRKVKIGKVRFTLLSGPGFTISDVEIAEDPALRRRAIFAWVPRIGSLDARLDAEVALDRQARVVFAPPESAHRQPGETRLRPLELRAAADAQAGLGASQN